MESIRVSYERDDRSDSFRMIGDVIATIAENKGIEIDEVTRARWRDTLGLLREFDTLIDDEQMPPIDAVMELWAFDNFKQHYPSLGPPEINEETHLRMVRRVALILEHSEALRHTTNIEDFLFHRREEVDHTSELLADCATSDVTTQPGFYTLFMPTLRAMGRSANFIDTITDHRQDFLEGKASIAGTRAFYQTMGKNALHEFMTVSPVLCDRRVIGQFYHMSVMRLRNRVQHGKTPYSSIKNIL